jgi:hypothetical protein
MRTSAHLYPSSILVLFLLELLGPRFVAARVRYHTDDSIEVKYYGNPEFLTQIEMLSLCTSSPIYLTLVIKGCSFLEKFEQRTQNVLQRGALL